MDKPWPLHVIDLQGELQKVLLEPGLFWSKLKGLVIFICPFSGEMLLYESLKIVHGRPEPFEGRFFDNIFVHFKPTKKWIDSAEDAIDLYKSKLTKEDLM